MALIGAAALPSQKTPISTPLAATSTFALPSINAPLPQVPQDDAPVCHRPDNKVGASDEVTNPSALGYDQQRMSTHEGKDQDQQVLDDIAKVYQS